MAEHNNRLVPVSRDEIVILLESGYVLMNMGKWNEAREVFNGAAALLPKSEVPRLALGTLEFALGRHDKALQEYRKAQQLNPQSALPRAHAGEALLFLGKANEAVRELKAALELEPEGDGGKLARALLEAKEAGALPPPKAAKK
ncbi:MAG: tetratricopeptide repeat protein [Myxococcales bacterium]|jgi:tetratricopeptide (TPR) repeat protein